MLALAEDMWDPNTWVLESDHEFRIYGDNYANHYAIVDQEDYEWLIRDGHLWNVNWKRSQRGRGPLKPYMRRAIGVNANGERLHTFTLYLHQAIVDRMGLVAPSKMHVLIDHRNGNSLDCRRANLRWVTHSQNSKNVYGSHSHELADW